MFPHVAFHRFEEQSWRLEPFQLDSALSSVKVFTTPAVLNDQNLLDLLDCHTPITPFCVVRSASPFNFSSLLVSIGSTAFCRVVTSHLAATAASPPEKRLSSV
ncbi:hypothetical protein E4T56_gene13389 [Termitomyces sp. T112]|nr:hypothetical protein E4T56_gene13389 [Termitomyces sp. T112]